MPKRDAAPSKAVSPGDWLQSRPGSTLVPKSKAQPAEPEACRTPRATADEAAPDDLLAIFGENLKAARLKSGLKQSDLAEMLGITQPRIAHIEAGQENLTLKTMMRLAQVVDHDVSAMLKRSQPPP